MTGQQSDGCNKLRHTNCYVVQRYKGIEIFRAFLIFNKNGEVIDVQNE
jgi:hypothetical protein